MEEGTPMVANAKVEPVGAAAPKVNGPEPAAKDDEKGKKGDPVPSGCVTRNLNFRDRNLLIGVAREHATGDRADFKGQAKVTRLHKLLSFEETLDYFAMMDESLEEAQRTWKRKKKEYADWRDYRESLIAKDAFKKLHPAIDPDEDMEKPPLRIPELTPEESRGPSRDFHLPSKLDAWVQDALREYNWNSLAAEYNVELCEKFGIKEEGE